MEIVLIIIGIFALYWRTQNYYYLIDDIVRRWDYLYVVPETSPPPSFFSSKPSKWRHFFLSVIHSINVWIVYLLWGWVPATLFAFSPLSVPCTAWITGGYYAVTTLLTLTAYFFLHTYPNWVGALISSIFFTAALGSTITCLGLPFIFLVFNHWGLVLFYPLMTYLTGRRFKKGFQIRDMGKKDFFGLHKIPVMTKVVAYYLYMTVFPYRLSFFKRFGEDYTACPKAKKNIESINGWFWLSLSGIALFVLLGWQLSPLGVVWFLFMIAPFSQFKVLGQFIAERYIYLPSIGWYLILGNALAPHPVLLSIVVGLYALRSHFYIPAYEKMESLYEDGIRNSPNCLAHYANLGERYIHIGRLAEGRKVLEGGIRLETDNFLCHTNMAAYWVNVRDMRHGAYYTEKAIELSKTKSSWFIGHAMKEQMKSLIAHEKLVNESLHFTPLSLTMQTNGIGIRWAGTG